MKRVLYTPDHEAFREVVREFVAREVVDNLERWEEDRLIDRRTWEKAGKQGLLGLSAEEDYGGAGQSHDYRYRSVLMEELARVHATSLSSSFALQDDIAIPYITSLGTAEQKARWVPGMCTGRLIGAIAMTEPGTGSDLRAIRTSATRSSGGWTVTGAKTFITNGIQSDLIIVVTRTAPAGGSSGFSLLVVERGMPGLRRGRKLKKVGLHAQDTAELFFDEVLVPHENVLGEVGSGLGQLTRHLPLERLSIAVNAVAAAEAVYRETVTYVKERTIFGSPVADFQNTRFELADVHVEIEVTRAFVDAAISAFNSGDLSAADAAKAKLWASEVQNRVVDRCLQLFGGYGYMVEYPVARAFQDARIQRIYGGTSEVMRHIIGREIFGRR